MGSAATPDASSAACALRGMALQQRSSGCVTRSRRVPRPNRGCSAAPARRFRRARHVLRGGGERAAVVMDAAARTLVTNEIASVTTQLRADWRAAAAACACLLARRDADGTARRARPATAENMAGTCARTRGGRPCAALLGNEAAAPLPRGTARGARARRGVLHRLPRALPRHHPHGGHERRRDAAGAVCGALFPERRPADARPGA
jgi:hypothetical protein